MNILLYLLKKYPDKDWSWNYISRNPNITFEFIEKHPEKAWNWNYISRNPNITMDIIEKHPEKPWNWDCISYNPNITMDIIEKYPNKPWNWRQISRNINLNMEMLDKYQNKSWNWKSRRAALALLGKTARLHGITLNNGQILKSVQIIDGEVDIVVVLKTIKDCSCDRVNVVRETASKAMVEFDEADLIPEAFKARFAPKKDRSPAYIKPATDGKHSKLSISIPLHTIYFLF